MVVSSANAIATAMTARMITIVVVVRRTMAVYHHGASRKAHCDGVFAARVRRSSLGYRSLPIPSELWKKSRISRRRRQSAESGLKQRETVVMPPFHAAERAGFEPAFPFGKHALQACALNQATRPLQSLQSGAIISCGFSGLPACRLFDSLHPCSLPIPIDSHPGTGSPGSGLHT
jgi:hypothetical protein